MRMVYLLVIASALYSLTASAGSVMHYGKDPEFWNDFSLVYGVVEGVSDVGISECKVSFRPVATLTGSFDCGLSARVVLRVFRGLPRDGDRVPYPYPPKSGVRVVVLIKKREDPQKDRRYVVPSSEVMFMPKESAFVVVASIEDAAVSRIMEKIRSIRIKTGKETSKE